MFTCFISPLSTDRVSGLTSSWYDVVIYLLKYGFFFLFSMDFFFFFFTCVGVRKNEYINKIILQIFFFCLIKAFVYQGNR